MTQLNRTHTTLAVAATILLTTWFANAGEPKATLFRDLAQSTVQSLYGRPGDLVDVELKDMDHGANTREVWQVSLTNGAHTGSAIYEVHIDDKGAANEGEEVAQIRVIYVTGN
ncbi:MAG TPA: hypothetical protein PLZ57_12340 [Pseudobdellovibrionaceae bacterium]|nr:hypothetical protein [Pseudobdellovibrionaceae bacterium]